MLSRDYLIDLILSPFICDPVRYLVAISEGLTLDDIKESSQSLYFEHEPRNSSELTLTIAAIIKLDLDREVLSRASQSSKRWKYIMENFVRLNEVFSSLDFNQRRSEERKYLNVPAAAEELSSSNTHILSSI